MNLPANARTSPEGEKETVWTQPPAGLANSLQTVPNGSFSPQNVGAGLENIRESTISSRMRDWRSLLVYILDVRREYAGLHVCASSGQQNIVRVPVDGKDGGPDRFLEELRDPPITLLIKRADSDRPDNNQPVNPSNTNQTAVWIAPSSASNSKLILQRTPPNESSGTIDVEQHQRRLPFGPARLGVGRLSPHVRVPILRGGNDPV